MQKRETKLSKNKKFKKKTDREIQKEEKIKNKKKQMHIKRKLKNV